ncbi:hypothetical protein V496_10477 [Pseudogymnoascus sp. VKM F-4515 (FW-2607)]|nr:hypothetical protein V496_10477 [Pseudogymnoascus sp. VKM F-4515 (FW-2607)]
MFTMITPENLRDLVEEYDIQFEGPTPSRKWPDRYRHLFQVIRDISANRYDEYVKRTDIDQKTMNKQTSRVRKVIDIAIRFRRNISSYEDTWRDAIETTIMGFLKEEVVCQSCGREIWDSEYKAHPLDKREREELERKSQKRSRCNCPPHNQSVIWIDDDSDDELGEPIFQTVIGERVSHVPEDDLDSYGIPMKPDRVLGLSRTTKVRESIEACVVNLVHAPVEGNDMIYPFLILEAKREKNPPGFRAIEAQTAFAIRRFLRIQEDLHTSCQSHLDPLVWFFAYQGDEWRLYAAIINYKKTRIFHLWHGIVESEDGILQLLQIIEFIATWGRDVYRPQIRRCLAGLPNPYKRSPSFDESVRSQLWPLKSRTRSFSIPLLSSMQEEILEAPTGNGQTQNDQSYVQQGFHDASSNSFLRWSLCRDLSKSWALNSSIRHSDIVMFSFRVFEVPNTEKELKELILSLENDQNAQTAIFHLLSLMEDNPYTFVLKRGDIPKMEKCWTGANTPSSYESCMENPSEIVRILVFFRSCCQSNDWQLNREMYCIIWSPTAARIFGSHFSKDVTQGFEESGFQRKLVSDVIQSFQQLRSLSGKCSVAYALGGICYILQPYQDLSYEGSLVHWRSPQEGGLPTPMIEKLSSLFNSAAGGDIVQLRQYQGRSLLGVTQGQQPYNTPTRLSQVANNLRQHKAVMAIKPDFWPQECPRFCLFVLLEQDFDDEDILRDLLHDTIRTRTFLPVYKGGIGDQPSWTVDDENLLKDWKQYFSEENMLKF